ncbi:MAG: Rdx family protein [Candidatus Krumholzibacteria bacterium]|nr:Rdx family protein [Candidatus Krumholzibacteria bacterium]
MPKASGLEAELREVFDNIDVELIGGRGGVFDVHVDEELIYSKHETGRFPDDDEIAGIIESV